MIGATESVIVRGSTMVRAGEAAGAAAEASAVAASGAGAESVEGATGDAGVTVAAGASLGAPGAAAATWGEAVSARCAGLWTHAETAYRVRDRSAYRIRLIAAVVKFRTPGRRAKFPGAQVSKARVLGF